MLAVFAGLCAIGLPPGVPSTAGIASGLYNLLLGGGVALAFVASGAGLGLLIADRCRGVDLELEPEVGVHRVACHAVAISPRT